MSYINPESHYQQLALKWLEGTITAEEIGEFTKWYKQDQELPVLIPGSHAGSEEEHRAHLFHQINERIRRRKQRNIRFLGRLAAAALALLILSSVAYLYVTGTFQRKRIPAGMTRDIAPGSDKAVLSLQNGSVFKLDELSNGIVKEINGVRIRKEDGKLSYEQINPSSGKMVYNTIKVPRGGQYKVVLPDSSQVWLNAASSLRYPVAFTGDVRYVELTGEAYFDISRQPGRPFRVNVDNKNTVEVTGTAFNISAYPDEPGIRTTLVEGKVKVFTTDKHQVERLDPGQESFMGADGKLVVNEAADIEAVIAWKNGLTLFRDASLQSIMRQVSRWYDIDVEYQGQVEERLFTGGISRKSNLSSLLKILELNNIHFEVEENKIIVKP